MRPNILLISVDQMRKDCIGALGHPIIETPNLDNMKREGAAFRNAYTAVPSCIASRAALLTGLSQKSHGRVGYEDNVLWNYEHTLPGELAKAGYHTQCVGKMHVYPARNLCGFHNVVLHDGYLHCSRKSSVESSQHWKNTDDYLPWLRSQVNAEADIIDSGLDCNSWVARPWPYEEHLHPTNWTVTKSIEFLEKRDPTKPFFLMTSFVRPHSPLDPPKYYYDMYINEEIPESYMGHWADNEDKEENGLITNTRKGKIHRRALKRAKAAYFGLITHIDHQIGRLMQALHDNNVLHNTVVMFVSDHGDLLGDHNLYAKSYPYEGSAGIPFMIYDPGNNLNFKHNIELNSVVELRDVMPTLLDIARVEIPKGVEGKSVIPLIKGQNFEWREYIHGEHSNGLYSNHYIVTNKDKYLWYSVDGQEQYFDLQKDPTELHNQSENKDYKERINYLRNLLINELVDREEGYTDGLRLIAGRKAKSSLNHIKSTV